MTLKVSVIRRGKVGEAVMAEGECHDDVIPRCWIAVNFTG